MSTSPILRWLIFFTALLFSVLKARSASVPPDPFSGSWAGAWQSAYGHHGKLLCEFTRADAHHYGAHFTAYWLAFHSGYTVLFETKRRGPVLRFSGQQDLGKLYGGLYHYTGSVTPAAFEAGYTAAADHGTFSLKRARKP